MILLSENLRQLISFEIQKTASPESVWPPKALGICANSLKIPSTFDVFLVTKPIYSPCRWLNSLNNDRK